MQTAQTHSEIEPQFYLKPSHDRRRHQRVKVKLLGRFMRQNKSEYPCQVQDISVGGVALLTPISADIGEHIIAYLDEIGRIEGPVIRLIDGGFAMQFKASQRKRDKLAAQLTWLVNRSHLGLANARRHDRLVPSNAFVQLSLADNRSLSAKVLDVSLSGASIALNFRPEIGTNVTLGKMRAKVVRHHSEGIAVEFLDIQNPAALRRFFT